MQPPTRLKCAAPSWLPVDPYILALLGHRRPRRAAARPRAGRRRRRAAPPRQPSRCSSSSTAPGSPPARRWTGCATGGSISPSWPAPSSSSRCSAWPPAGWSRAPDAHRSTPACSSSRLVPSTIQSSIAFTSIARGNVPAAICAGSFSTLVGIVLTPLLAAALLGSSGGGFSAGLAAQDRAPAAAAVPRRAVAAPLDRRLHHPAQEGPRLRRPRLDPARRLHRVQRGHGPGHLAPGQRRCGCGALLGGGGRAARRDAARSPGTARSRSASAARTASPSSSPARRSPWPPDCPWPASCSAPRPASPCCR